ncbi:MAG TPA: nucleotide exchange factor GrpE [Halomicronema sp.]
MIDFETSSDNSQNPEEAAGGSPTTANQTNPPAPAPDEQPDVDLADLGSPDLEAYAQAMAGSYTGAQTDSHQTALAIAQAEIETKTRDNEQLKAHLEDIKNQYARLAADFDNFRKRTQKEKEDQEIQIKCSTLKELLPVVDNFERARSVIKPQTDSEMNIHKSYQSVYKLLVDGLKRAGVSPMRPEGQPFDPNFHEAVMRETTDQYPEGTVTEELVRGYVLGEKVLRHSMVKVAAAPEPTSQTDQTEAPADSET